MQIVVPVVLSLLVGVGLYYGLGAGASTTALAALALAALLVGAIKPRKKAILKASAIIAVLCSLPVITRVIIINIVDKKSAVNSDPQPVSVQPSLEWSGPLSIGQNGAFTIPLISGYSHVRIQFGVQDANRYGPVCSTNTELAVATGPANNSDPAGELGPGDWSIGIPLAGFTGTIRVQVTVGTTLDGQRNCPVDITVPRVILTSS
jgi:hypothetical protein